MRAVIFIVDGWEECGILLKAGALLNLATAFENSFDTGKYHVRWIEREGSHDPSLYDVFDGDSIVKIRVRRAQDAVQGSGQKGSPLQERKVVDKTSMQQPCECGEGSSAPPH